MFFVVGYLHEDVRDFAKITTLVMDLLKVTWTSDSYACFEALKKSLTEAPFLRIMGPLKDAMVLCMNTNDMATCVILMQEGVVIAHESRKSNNKKLIYFIHEKKLVSNNSCIESLASLFIRQCV